jgi:hypothetical protein
MGLLPQSLDLLEVHHRAFSSNLAFPYQTDKKQREAG